MKKEDAKMYANLVKDLSNLMQESSLSSLKFKHQTVDDKNIVNKIVIELHDQSSYVASAPVANIIQQPIAQAPTSNTTVEPTPEENYSSHTGAILSPMVGIIYTAINKDSSPFVEIDSIVNLGDTLFLIEAMKVFNPIKATKAGKVTKILVKNNTAVEFNEPLIIIE